MTRRRWLIVLGRMLTAWALLTVQGVCDTAHLAALSLVPSGAPLACARVAPPPVAAVDAKAHHDALCKCRTCQGPKHCCCLGAQTDADAAALRAVCDSPTDQILSGAVDPTRALPPVLGFAVVRRLIPLPDAPPLRQPGYRPQFPEPSTPPPTV